MPQGYTAISVPPNHQGTTTERDKAKSRVARFAKYLPTDFMASFVRTPFNQSTNDSGSTQDADPTTTQSEGMPFAVCSDGTSQGFFAYEMENNRMLSLLQEHAREYSSFVLSLMEQSAILLVPQDVSMQSFELSQRFLETHAITIVNQSVEGTIFMTLSGILGYFDAQRENISILDLNEFSKAPVLESHSFSNTCRSPSGQQVPRLQILREGQVHLSVPSEDGGEPIICPVGLILISDVLWAHPDDWKGSSETLLDEGTMDPHDQETQEAAKRATELEAYQQMYREKIMHIKAKKLRENIKIFLANSKKRLPADYHEACEQINNFIEQVMISIRANPLWHNANSGELSVAHDNITRTVLTQLYDQVFAPAELRKSDQQLYQTIDKLWFVSPDHLDIQCNDWDITLWQKAKEQLLAMGSFKTAKEKIACVLRCSKTIIFLLNSKGGVAGADDFLPHMIFAVILSNPPYIQCNIEFIRSFCSPSQDDDLGESFYYLTILESAVYFIQNINAQSLGLSEALFERYMKDEIARTERPMVNQPPSVEEEEPTTSAHSPMLLRHTSSEEILPLPPPMTPEVRGISPVTRMPASPLTPSIPSPTSPSPPPGTEETSLTEEVGPQPDFNFSANDISFLEHLSSPIPARREEEPDYKRQQMIEETIAFVADSMINTPPSYADAHLEQLGPEDLRLLLEEYKHMAAVLGMISSLKKT